MRKIYILILTVLLPFLCFSQDYATKGDQYANSETKNIRSSIELLIFFIHFEAIRRIPNPVKNPQKSRFFTQKIPQKFLSKF